MFPVERILQQLDNIFTNGMFRGKPFGPCQDSSRIQRGLFYRKGERETEGQDIVVGRNQELDVNL